MGGPGKQGCLGHTESTQALHGGELGRAAWWSGRADGHLRMALAARCSNVPPGRSGVSCYPYP